MTVATIGEGGLQSPSPPLLDRNGLQVSLVTTEEEVRYGHLPQRAYRVGDLQVAEIGSGLRKMVEKGGVSLPIMNLSQPAK